MKFSEIEGFEKLEKEVIKEIEETDVDETISEEAKTFFYGFKETVLEEDMNKEDMNRLFRALSFLMNIIIKHLDDNS